jgi:outer membrane protein OmpA-like peptidoglycan-associated protein
LLFLAACPGEAAPPVATVAPPEQDAGSAPAPVVEDRSCAAVCGAKPRCARVAERIAFEKGSIRLPADARASLESVARWLQATPDVLEIEVRGYAHDMAGKRELVIASDRAAAATKWLAANGVAAKRVVARGFANAPQDPPHVESGVEFVVTRPDQAGCCDASCT